MVLVINQNHIESCSTGISCKVVIHNVFMIRDIMNWRVQRGDYQGHVFKSNVMIHLQIFIQTSSIEALSIRIWGNRMIRCFAL
mmetsp:Transcript_88986/g.256590  ORF Transcript_88986/g.256590 Transcript_88986/m.256590 type:complete len:83 (+) Transcript_88986:3279-3527(+)